MLAIAGKGVARGGMNASVRAALVFHSSILSSFFFCFFKITLAVVDF